MCLAAQSKIREGVLIDYASRADSSSPSGVGAIGRGVLLPPVVLLPHAIQRPQHVSIHRRVDVSRLTQLRKLFESVYA